jgi:protein-tyrosine phosphatase
MAVACLLVDAGLAGDAAIALVRATRPGTIETSSQEAFVRGRGDRRDDVP